MNSIKYIVSSETNLKQKYGKDFSRLQRSLKKLIAADKARNIDTRILYIDNAASAKKAKIKAVGSTTEQDCKRAIDNLYKKHQPDYILILGAQDIIPFQLIDNPAGDDGDWDVPSDLPYACDAPFSRNISSFTGPTRVVGRVPDIPGVADVRYFEQLIDNIVNHSPIDADRYRKYFSVSAKVWQKSTQKSLSNIFGHNTDLLLSPIAAPKNGYLKKHFKPLTHFFNCHGAKLDWSYYGQHGESYPIALDTNNLPKNIGYGTVVAAECCYGAELIDPTKLPNGNGVGNKTYISIANNYLKNGAISFVGSSTIAYGPPDGQALADLITQFFIINILEGKSAGAAFLNARQRFISEEGPTLDPYELKTLAQFYLLGDPSIRPAMSEEDKTKDVRTGNTTRNDRAKMMVRGTSLQKSTSPAVLLTSVSTLKSKKPLGMKLPTVKLNGGETAVAMMRNKEVQKIFREIKLKKFDRAMTFHVKPAALKSPGKKAIGHGAKFHTFVNLKRTPIKINGCSVKIEKNSVLVIKEEGHKILGWRLYVAK